MAIRSPRASSTSLNQWVGCVFIGLGVCASTSIYECCVRLLDENRVGSFATIFAVLGLFRTLTMTLLVLLFLVLVRWPLIKQIEYLGFA